MQSNNVITPTKSNNSKKEQNLSRNGLSLKLPSSHKRCKSSPDICIGFVSRDLKDVIDTVPIIVHNKQTENGNKRGLTVTPQSPIKDNNEGTSCNT